MSLLGGARFAKSPLQLPKLSRLGCARTISTLRGSIRIKYQPFFIIFERKTLKMPGLLLDGSNGIKRKRKGAQEAMVLGVKARKTANIPSDGTNFQERILLLEEQLQSREHYNNLSALQTLADDVNKRPKKAAFAAVALCRVWCRLIATEELAKRKEDSEQDAQVKTWLKQMLRQYVDSQLAGIGSPDATRESTALTLLMRIVKAETLQENRRGEQAWRTETALFYRLVVALMEQSDAEGARQEFIEKYVEECDDVRFYAMLAIKQYFSVESKRTQAAITNAFDMLSKIEGVPDSEDELSDWYGQPPDGPKHQLLSLAVHRKMAQECWLSIFRSPLTIAHRKQILSILTSQILPWFPTRTELLTDFLTDSFNSSGSVALLALSGIFHLMTARNLDYPDFYTKLYSLLDDEVLHSKHRSRFFRLLEKFMASDHLPAALVASFIKRLGRLALHAPPGAIVWIVPWTYNMMRQHPACTFMLHRPYHPAHVIYANNPNDTEEGAPDPFNPTETDPMQTNAIDSSLWEMHTLQDHWHPNVATLAKILGEQFTKREYQLEDFLDHSYATLVDAELGKEIKAGRKVEVEWEIPKRIVTAEGGTNALGGLLEMAMRSV